MKNNKVILHGQVDTLVEELELGSTPIVTALVDELKFGASVYDKRDDHQNAVMVLLLNVIVRELSGYDVRAMTDKEIDRLAFRIAIETTVQRKLGDNGTMAIKDAIKSLRDEQNSY